MIIQSPNVAVTATDLKGLKFTGIIGNQKCWNNNIGLSENRNCNSNIRKSRNAGHPGCLGCTYLVKVFNSLAVAFRQGIYIADSGQCGRTVRRE